jgi:hypothetical protein
MFRVAGFAKRRNALMGNGQFGAWHPQHWTEWDKPIACAAVGALAKTFPRGHATQLRSPRLVEP